MDNKTKKLALLHNAAMHEGLTPKQYVTNLSQLGKGLNLWKEVEHHDDGDAYLHWEFGFGSIPLAVRVEERDGVGFDESGQPFSLGRSEVTFVHPTQLRPSVIAAITNAGYDHSLECQIAASAVVGERVAEEAARQVFTRKQAAVFLGVSVDILDKYVASGELVPADVRASGSREQPRLSRRDLEAFYESRKPSQSSSRRTDDELPDYLGAQEQSPSSRRRV